MTDKRQAHLSSKKVTGTRLCRVLGSGNFYSPPSTVCLSHTFQKKGALWDWYQYSKSLLRNTVLLKQIKALDTSQAGPPKSVTLKCMGRPL